MYTELVLNVSIKDETSDDVLSALKWMLDSKAPTEFLLIDHELFSLSRAQYMLRSSSYYFIPQPSSSLIEDCYGGKTHYLSIRCDLKNYESEIETFLSWISTYLECGFAGYMRYEENDDPTLIYIDNGDVKYLKQNTKS